MRFVDTNVLLYSISDLPGEAAKASVARGIMAGTDLVLSVQVLQEFYVQAIRPSRPNPITHQQAVRLIQSWCRFPVQDVTLGLMQEALVIKERYQLSYWDSAIIAAAKLGNCSEVLSEDMNDGQDYGGVKVLDPFKP